MHKQLTYSLALSSCFALLTPNLATAHGASGAMTLNLDENALAKLNGGSNTLGKRFMYLEEYLDQTYNNVLIDGATPDPTPGTNPIPAKGLQFVVNGASIASPNPTLRTNVATNFSFNDDPTKATGQVGFSGAIRFRSDSWKGILSMSELSLHYEASRAAAGGTGWVIKTNQPFFGSNGLFDLTNVTTYVINGALGLTANVAFALEWSVVMAILPGDIVGNVCLQPAAASTDNASYDMCTQGVTIQDVQVQNQHFQVQLQGQGNNQFALKMNSVKLLGAPQHNQPAQYNDGTKLLNLPKVQAFGKYYQVNLKNMGNFVFNLDSITEIK